MAEDTTSPRKTPQAEAASDTVNEAATINAPQFRRLRLGMALMSGVLVLSFMVVAAAFVWRLGNPSPREAKVAAPEGRFGLSQVGIAQGEVVRTVSMEGERLVIHVEGKQGDSIILVDARTGAELGRVLVTPVSDFVQR